MKLAYQDQTIRELDALVRAFGAKLDEALRELRELKQACARPRPRPARRTTSRRTTDRAAARRSRRPPARA